MDKFHLVYACLNLKFPSGYRTSAGAKYTMKLQAMSLEELKSELAKLQSRRRK